MATVTLHDLRTRTDEILDQLERGASFTVLHDGRPAAELVALHRGTDTARLLRSWRVTPTAELACVRADLESVLDDRV